MGNRRDYPDYHWSDKNCSGRMDNRISLSTGSGTMRLFLLAACKRRVITFVCKVIKLSIAISDVFITRILYMSLGGIIPAGLFA